MFYFFGTTLAGNISNTKIMRHSVRHTINPLVLWIGILTALLLILSALFNTSDAFVQLELNNDLLEYVSLEKVKSITSAVQESFRWLKP
jgi:hypothetical protein